MRLPRNVLLLIGSPRGEKSNSHAIGKFLLDKLAKKGSAPQEAYITQLVKTSEGTERLLKYVDNADILILTAPLYNASLHSLTIKALEIIYEHRKTVTLLKPQMLVALINSGMPEKEHNDIALKIIRNFAQQSNFMWGGGIRVGWGEFLNRKPLKEKSWMTRKLTKGLSLAAVNLLEDLPISEEAKALAETLFLPLFIAKVITRVIVNRMWTKQANQNKVKCKIYDRPYELNQ